MRRVLAQSRFILESRQGAHISSTFLEYGNEALAPSQNGVVYDRYAALRRQIAHITITQFVSDIPPLFARMLGCVFDNVRRNGISDSVQTQGR
jgi:hypothetical protein